MKPFLYTIMGIGIAAALIYGAIDQDNPVRGRALGALCLVAALPLLLTGSVVYDAVKIRKEKKVSWRKAFYLAANKPPKLDKDKKDEP